MSMYRSVCEGVSVCECGFVSVCLCVNLYVRVWMSKRFCIRAFVFVFPCVSVVLCMIVCVCVCESV